MWITSFGWRAGARGACESPETVRPNNVPKVWTDISTARFGWGTGARGNLATNPLKPYWYVKKRTKNWTDIYLDREFGLGSRTNPLQHSVQIYIAWAEGQRI